MTQVFPALQVTPDIPETLVPLVVRKERRENQEKQANEANPAKMATLVPQVSLESKESLAFLVHQAEMEKEDLKGIEDTQVPQEW